MLTILVILNSSLVSAAISNPGVPVFGIPVATQFFMPFGDRTADIVSALHTGVFNGFVTTRFDVGFKHVVLNNDKTCGNQGTGESFGWFVFTPLTSTYHENNYHKTSKN